MKKTAILLALCMAALSGCGRVDSVDVDSDIKPFEIEKTTSEEDDSDSEEIPSAAVTTVSGETQTGVTTVKTGAVNLIKRTGVVTAAKRTVAPSRGTVRVPSRPNNNTQRPAGTNAPTVTTAVVTTTVAVTAPPVTTIPDSENPAVVVRDDMTCRVGENSISVTYKGEPVQNIQISTDFMINAYANGNTDPSVRLNINDYDFDGNYDLFVPQSSDNYNTYGKYLRFNPTTNVFEEWSALGDISTSAITSADDGTLAATVKTNDTEFEEKTYEWQTVNEVTGEKQLTLIRKKKQFLLDSANPYDVYIDYYEYTNGVEELVKREKHIYDENNQYIGVEEIPIEWTI